MAATLAVQKDKDFVSATSATFLPLKKGFSPETLRCSKELWEKARDNPQNECNTENVYQPTYMDIAPTSNPNESPNDLNPLSKRLAWHVRDVLVRYAPGFADRKADLGLPEPVEELELEKTVQVPARLMHISEGSIDGNAHVLENLIKQAGIPKDKLDEYVILVHGDLATLERINSLKEARGIEANAFNRASYVVDIPGNFHVKINANEAVYRAHLASKDLADAVNSPMSHVEVSRPKETGKFKSNWPGFRKTRDQRVLPKLICHSGMKLNDPLSVLWLQATTEELGRLLCFLAGIEESHKLGRCGVCLFGYKERKVLE